MTSAHCVSAGELPDLLIRLLHVTETLQALAAAGLMDRIPKKLQDREVLISQLASLLDRLRHDGPSGSMGRSVVTDTLKEVLTTGAALENALVSAKERVADELGTVSSGHKVFRSYTPDAQAVPHYLRTTV